MMELPALLFATHAPTKMTAPISFTRMDLKYPLFAAEFDPYNRGYLVVGGGGGESNTGVANKIVREHTPSNSC